MMVSGRPHHIPGYPTFSSFTSEPGQYQKVSSPSTPKNQISGKAALQTPPPPPSPSQPSTPRAVRVRRPAIVSFDSRSLTFSDGKDSITQHAVNLHKDGIRTASKVLMSGTHFSRLESDEITLAGSLISNQCSEDELKWVTDSEDHERLTVGKDFSNHNSPISSIYKPYPNQLITSDNSFLTPTRERSADQLKRLPTPFTLSLPTPRRNSTLYLNSSLSRPFIRSTDLNHPITLMAEMAPSIHSTTPEVTCQDTYPNENFNIPSSFTVEQHNQHANIQWGDVNLPLDTSPSSSHHLTTTSPFLTHTTHNNPTHSTIHTITNHINIDESTLSPNTLRKATSPETSRVLFSKMCEAENWNKNPGTPHSEFSKSAIDTSGMTSHRPPKFPSPTADRNAGSTDAIATTSKFLLPSNGHLHLDSGPEVASQDVHQAFFEEEGAEIPIKSEIGMGAETHYEKPSLDESFKFPKAPEMKVKGVSGTANNSRNDETEWEIDSVGFTVKPKHYPQHFAEFRERQRVYNDLPIVDNNMSHGLERHPQSSHYKSAPPVREDHSQSTHLPQHQYPNQFVRPNPTDQERDTLNINTLLQNQMPILKTDDGEVATLQGRLADRIEENTQLRIKLAVLENDLRHKTTEAEEQIKGFSLFVRTLGPQFPALSNTFATPNGVSEHIKDATATETKTAAAADAKLGKEIMKLEMEVDVLRRENRMLRAQDRGQRLSAQLNFQSRTQAEENQEIYEYYMNKQDYDIKPKDPGVAVLPQTPLRTNFNHEQLVQAKQPEEEAYVDNSGLHDGSFQQADQPETDLMDFEQDLTEEHEKQGLYVEDYDYYHEFEAKVRELENPVLKVKYSPSAAKVGILSLEDSILAIDTVGTTAPNPVELAAETEKPRLSKSPAPALPLGDEAVKEPRLSKSPPSSLPSEDEEMSYNPIPHHLRNYKDHHAFQRLNRHTAPTVLKTGFDSEGALCGRDYESRKNALWHRPAVPLFSVNTGAGKVWDTREERINALENQRLLVGDRAVRFQVGFFKYGINFVPGEGEYQYLETVHIGNLPDIVEVRDILNRVRGGKIVSVILVNTMTFTGKMGALIRFVDEKAAQRYVSFVADNPVSFGEEDEKLQAEVNVLGSPSYPLSSGLNNAIFKLKHTRCICIPYFPNISISAFKRDICSATQYQRGITPTEMWMDEDRTMHLEFASISDAGVARGKLNAWSIFRGLEIRSEPDPCERLVEELLLGVEPRKPLFPRGGFVDGTQFRQETSAKEPSENHLADNTDARRTRFAALTLQKVEIPAFHGAGIRSSSWADEVIDEIQLPSTTSARSIKDENTAMLPSIVATSDNTVSHRKSVTGFAASTYAPKRSNFENGGTAHSTSQSLGNQSQLVEHKPQAEAKENASHDRKPPEQIKDESSVRNPSEILCDLGNESTDVEEEAGSVATSSEWR